MTKTCKLYLITCHILFNHSLGKFFISCCEEFLPQKPGPGNCFQTWPILNQQFLDHLERLYRLGPGKRHGLLLVVGVHGRHDLSLEQVPGLQGVLDGVGEVLESANGDGILRRLEHGVDALLWRRRWWMEPG